MNNHPFYNALAKVFTLVFLLNYFLLFSPVETDSSYNRLSFPSRKSIKNPKISTSSNSLVLYKYKWYVRRMEKRKMLVGNTSIILNNNNTKFGVTVIMTTESFSSIVRNTILHLGIYVKYLGIKAVVFTNNTEVKTLCNYMKVSTAPVPEVNVYGMPVLRSMVSTARQYYSNDYVMYINSDILINPDLFSAISSISSFIGNNTFYGSVVYNIHIPDFHNCTSIICLNTLFKSFSRSKKRGDSGTDIFVFSPNYPVEKLKGAVIGRWRIDPLVIKIAKKSNLDIVDLTDIPSFHQGYENVKRKQGKTNKSDFFYNLQYIGMKEDGHFKFNYCVQNYTG